MKDPLTNLKSSMEKSVFKNFSFSKERKQAVKEAIQTKQSNLEFHTWSIETIITILESIQHESRDGYHISIQLLRKNDLSFQNNEGQLYTLLHLLESKEYLISKWSNSKKHYSLHSKGKKYLASFIHADAKQKISLKHLLEEASSL